MYYEPYFGGILGAKYLSIISIRANKNSSIFLGLPTSTWTTKTSRKSVKKSDSYVLCGHRGGCGDTEILIVIIVHSANCAMQCAGMHVAHRRKNYPCLHTLDQPRVDICAKPQISTRRENKHADIKSHIIVREFAFLSAVDHSVSQRQLYPAHTGKFLNWSCQD